MQFKRCKVEAAVTGNGFGRNFGPGQLVDMDEAMGPGTVRDFVNPDWFEDIEPAAENQQLVDEGEE